MKKIVTIKKYIPGLASFLDEQKIEWERAYSKGEEIKITIKSDEELFLLGYEFGKFYSEIEK